MSMTIRERILEARQQEMLTVEQVSLLTQFHPKSIYRMVKHGSIPGVRRYGNKIRFVRVLVLQWHQQHPSREASV